MSYDYETQARELLQPENIRALVETRDAILAVVRTTGAITMACAMDCWPGAGDSWTMMAAVDWMVAHGDLREIQQSPDPPGQHRIFVEARK